MTLLSRHRLIIGRDREASHRLEEGRFVALFFEDLRHELRLNQIQLL
jgi:hypothetical protein